MPASATAPRITAHHRLNRLAVVNDIAAFLLQHYAAAGTYTETVEAALNRACELDQVEWFALGILTGHYRSGGTPDPATNAAVITHLERLLPKPVAVDGTEFEGLDR